MRCARCCNRACRFTACACPRVSDATTPARSRATARRSWSSRSTTRASASGCDAALRSCWMRLVRADSPARAGLVGNPSDGFGGATLGLALANFSARVAVYEWPRFEVLPGEGDHCSFATLADFRQDLAANGYEGG